MAKKRRNFRNLLRQFSGKVPLPVPIIIGVVVVIIAVIGFILYKQGALSSLAPGLGGLPRATEKDFEFIEDATLRKHFVAQANTTRYRIKTYSDAADLNFTTEVQITGEFFNTRDIETTPDGKETKHKINLNETVYVKDFSDNKWWKQTYKANENPPEEEDAGPTDFKEEYQKPDLQFKSLGKEPCGNLTCFKYETSDPELGGAVRTFWFDDREYLLRKEKSTQAEFSVEVTYSYDNINITAPSPTKDVPAGKNIYDYYYGTSTPTNYPTQDYSSPTQDYPVDFPTVPDSEEIGY